MEDLKPKRKSRFEKGSDEARNFMATLRSKRGGTEKQIKPILEEAPQQTPPPETPTTKRKPKNEITVDF
jgi:hypothetical protein